MNNFGRAVLAVGLSAVMTFTGPECFFQSGVEPVSVYAAEEKAVQSKIAGDNSEEGESTTEVTTEKKEESTTATESQEARLLPKGIQAAVIKSIRRQNIQQKVQRGIRLVHLVIQIRQKIPILLHQIHPEIPLIVTKKEQLRRRRRRTFPQEKMQRFVQRRLRRLRIS